MKNPCKCRMLAACQHLLTMMARTCKVHRSIFGSSFKGHQEAEHSRIVARHSVAKLCKQHASKMQRLKILTQACYNETPAAKSTMPDMLRCSNTLRQRTARWSARQASYTQRKSASLIARPVSAMPQSTNTCSAAAAKAPSPSCL